MDDEEFVVKNADTDETLTVKEASEKFSVMTINDFESSDSKSRPAAEEEEEEDEYYYDSKQHQSLNLGQQSKAENYFAPEIPIGARLQFDRITAVGTSRDEKDKSYSVYYLDVKCHVASPNSWFIYRRYSQFRRLSDILRSEGYTVPILPPKKVWGTFNPDFVKQRKQELEAWLHKLSDPSALKPGSKDVQNHPFYRQFLIEGANQPPQPLHQVFPVHVPSLSTAADSKTPERGDSLQAKHKVKANCMIMTYFCIT